MFCRNCGQPVEENFVVCPNCGTPVNEQAAPGPEPTPAPGPAPVQALPTTPYGIASFILSLISIIFSFTFVLPILGIVFGALGRKQCDKGTHTGRGFATAGLIISIIMLVIGFILIGLLIAGIAIFSMFFY